MHGVQAPWILASDFNAMLNEDENKGGSRHSWCSCCLFQNFCSSRGLKDMGFNRPKFTWNKGSLFEHIDRVLCNYN